MKHFINLTSRVINKLHIVEIIKKPNVYHIYMSNNRFSGSMFFPGGYISSVYNIIKICEKNDKKDYDTITDLINKIN